MKCVLSITPPPRSPHPCYGQPDRKKTAFLWSPWESNLFTLFAKIQFAFSFIWNNLTLKCASHSSNILQSKHKVSPNFTTRHIFSTYRTSSSSLVTSHWTNRTCTILDIFWSYSHIKVLKSTFSSPNLPLSSFNVAKPTSSFTSEIHTLLRGNWNFRLFEYTRSWSEIGWSNW